MVRFRVCFLVLVMLVLCLPGQLFSQDPGLKSITWAISGDPPGFITQGPDKGQGAFDLFIAYLERNLPGYSFQQVLANSLRTYQTVKEGGNFIGVAFIPSPERRNEVLFSVPYVLAVPAGIIILERDWPLFKPYVDQKGRLDFRRALADPKIRLGIPAGRSFGAIIDPLLQEAKATGRLEERFSQEDLTRGLVSMLEHGRINCTLAYSGTVGYIIRDPKERSALHMVPLKENEAVIVPVALIVPMSPWGRAILEKLNPLIVKFRRTSEFAQIFGRWELDNGAQILRLMEQNGLR